METNLIYLAKHKLLGVDSILPILMEVKTIYPRTKMIVYLQNKAHLEEIEKNYHLRQGLEEIDAEICTMRDNKIKAIILFILKFALKRNVIIRDGDVFPLHRIVMKFMLRTKQVKVYSYMMSKEGHKNLATRKKLLSERGKGTPERDFLAGKYDHFLSQWLPNTTKTGYVYNLPAWRSFIKHNNYSEQFCDFRGVVRYAIKEPYFLYLPHCYGDAVEYLNGARAIDLLEEILIVLKKYNLKVVFKPHIYTDMNKLIGVLDKLKFLNYVIDYGHPMILSMRAKFVISEWFSRSMFDSYFVGTPTVEYASYDPELLKRMGGSFGGKCCDFSIQRNPKELDKAINTIMTKKITHDSKFIEENFPKTPSEFYWLLYELLGDEGGLDFD